MPLNRILLILLILTLIIPTESRVIESELLSDTEIQRGIYYKQFEMGSRSKKIRVHVLELEISKLKSLKYDLVGKNINELEKLTNYQKDDFTFAINASFFHRNGHPVGLNIIEEEIVKINRHNRWKSLIFEEESLKILNIDTESYLLVKNNTYKVSSYNQADYNRNIVVYNRFFGPTVPYINNNILDSVYSIYLFNNFHDMITSNSYEIPIPYSEFRNEIHNFLPKDFMDDTTFKYVLKSINKVNYIDSDFICISKEQGITQIKDNYILASNIPLEIKLGDTVKLFNKFEPEAKGIKYLINTTPQILKDGKEFITAKEEGVSSYRFIKKHLARSAFGYNSKKIFLVSVEPNRGNKIKGATLRELSWVMETLGCKDAINLDGGSSVSFILNGKNLVIPYNNDYSKEISTGLFIK